MRKWPTQVSTVVANVGRELSLLKMAINMANADYPSFFLWNELEPRCQQRAAGSLELPVDKLGDGWTDAGNDNTRRPILASGKNGLRNDQNAKISNWVSMRIFNELWGPLPVSWIRHTRCIISVKLKLIWQVVTPVESHMLTDGRMDGQRHTSMDGQRHTIIRPI